MKPNRKREWLISIRRQKCMTQQQVANSIGVQRASYTKYETGAREPHPKTAKRIGKVLNFNWTRFYE